jgi:hypothetical protein
LILQRPRDHVIGSPTQAVRNRRGWHREPQAGPGSRPLVRELSVSQGVRTQPGSDTSSRDRITVDTPSTTIIPERSCGTTVRVPRLIHEVLTRSRDDLPKRHRDRSTARGLTGGSRDERGNGCDSRLRNERAWIVRCRRHSLYEMQISIRDSREAKSLSSSGFKGQDSHAWGDPTPSRWHRKMERATRRSRRDRRVARFSSDREMGQAMVLFTIPASSSPISVR